MSQNSNWKINVSLGNESIEQWLFDVVLKNSDAEHIYLVSLDKEYYKELTNGNIVPLVLVQQAFLFLLSKEKPQEILSEFSLKDVTDYFKEFEKEMYDFAHESH